MSFLCSLFAGQDAYEKNWSALMFLPRSLESELSVCMEFAILGHVLFPRNLERVDTRLLEFQELVENGQSLVPTLLADTFRALNIITSDSTYLECCVMVCQPFNTKEASFRI